MSQNDATPQNASFRDPGGQVFRGSGRIFRAVNQASGSTLDLFLQSPLASSLEKQRKLVRTWVPDFLPDELAGSSARIVEHEAVPFPTYPSEWCPEMLASAGNLTLDLCEALLPTGWGLKDATPLNVLFQGPNPVFVDLLSFEPRDATDPSWIPYAQFVRTFLLPLLANRELGQSLRAIWLENRDGLDPEKLYPFLTLASRLSRPALGLVTLPALMSGKADVSHGTTAPQQTPADQTLFILKSLFRSLRKDLARLSPTAPQVSHWSDYADTLTHYDATQRSIKETFVRQSLAKIKPAWCLDMGANTGQFSEIAAGHSQVVAVDYDVASVGRIFRRARTAGLSILPICLDACRPTPATGWRNSEQPSFLSRCQGRFDMVMMLAVIHHMLVSERVPLPEIIGLAADLTTRHAIIEYVGPADPMFRKLLRGRDALHAGLTASVFEEALRQRFEIHTTCPIPGMDRILYGVTRLGADIHN